MDTPPWSQGAGKAYAPLGGLERASGSSRHFQAPPEALGAPDAPDAPGEGPSPPHLFGFGRGTLQTPQSESQDGAERSFRRDGGSEGGDAASEGSGPNTPAENTGADSDASGRRARGGSSSRKEPGSQRASSRANRRKSAAELPCPPGHQVYEFIQQAPNVIYETGPANLGNVCLSNISRSSLVHLSPDQLTMFGAQGYRTAKATHGVFSGLHYFECTVDYPPGVEASDILQAAPQFWPQWRVGLAGLDCECDAPLGYDARGFSLRSVDGSLCHRRRRYLRGQEGRWDEEDAQASGAGTGDKGDKGAQGGKDDTKASASPGAPAAAQAAPGPSPDSRSSRSQKSETKSDSGPPPPVVCDGPRVQICHDFTRTSQGDGFYFGPQAVVSCLVYLPTEDWPRLPQEIEYSVSLEAPWDSQRVSGRQDSTLPEHRTYKPSPSSGRVLSPEQKLHALLSKDLSEIQIGDLAYNESYDYDLNRAPFYRKPVPGSFIAIFCNGELSAVARNIPYDIYYPAASTFCYGTATFDFGPQNFRKPEFPREWAFYPPALQRPDVDRDSLCRHFRWLSEVHDCLVKSPELFGVSDGAAFLAQNPVVPFSSLYVERAKVEYANFIALIDSGKLTPSIWAGLSSWYASLLKRLKNRQK